MTISTAAARGWACRLAGVVLCVVAWGSAAAVAVARQPAAAGCSHVATALSLSSDSCVGDATGALRATPIPMPPPPVTSDVRAAITWVRAPRREAASTRARPTVAPTLPGEAVALIARAHADASWAAVVMDHYWEQQFSRRLDERLHQALAQIVDLARAPEGAYDKAAVDAGQGGRVSRLALVLARRPTSVEARDCPGALQTGVGSTDAACRLGPTVAPSVSVAWSEAPVAQARATECPADTFSVLGAGAPGNVRCGVPRKQPVQVPTGAHAVATSDRLAAAVRHRQGVAAMLAARLLQQYSREGSHVADPSRPLALNPGHGHASSDVGAAAMAAAIMALEREGQLLRDTITSRVLSAAYRRQAMTVRSALQLTSLAGSAWTSGGADELVSVTTAGNFLRGLAGVDPAILTDVARDLRPAVLAESTAEREAGDLLAVETSEPPALREFVADTVAALEPIRDRIQAIAEDTLAAVRYLQRGVTEGFRLTQVALDGLSQGVKSNTAQLGDAVHSLATQSRGELSDGLERELTEATDDCIERRSAPLTSFELRSCLSRIYTFADSASRDAVSTYPEGQSTADSELAPTFSVLGDALGYLFEVVNRDDLGRLGITNPRPSKHWFTAAARALIQLFRENLAYSQQPKAQQRPAATLAAGRQLRRDELAVRDRRIAQIGGLQFSHMLDVLQAAVALTTAYLPDALGLQLSGGADQPAQPPRCAVDQPIRCSDSGRIGDGSMPSISTAMFRNRARVLGRLDPGAVRSCIEAEPFGERSSSVGCSSGPNRAWKYMIRSRLGLFVKIAGGWKSLTTTGDAWTDEVHWCIYDAPSVADALSHYWDSTLRAPLTGASTRSDSAIMTAVRVADEQLLRVHNGAFLNVVRSDLVNGVLAGPAKVLACAITRQGDSHERATIKRLGGLVANKDISAISNLDRQAALDPPDPGDLARRQRALSACSASLASDRSDRTSAEAASRRRRVQAQTSDRWRSNRPAATGRVYGRASGAAPADAALATATRPLGHRRDDVEPGCRGAHLLRWGAARGCALRAKNFTRTISDTALAQPRAVQGGLSCLQT